MLHQQLYQRKIFIILGMIILLLLASILLISLPKRREVSLSPPTINCSLDIDWKGIVPGTSTRRDVLEILGKPMDQGRFKFRDGVKIPYYTYKVEGRNIPEWAQHRIFFRPDEYVDWIEVIIANKNGGYHTVQEIVDKLGNTLDAEYPNNNANPYAELQVDILAGPDRVFVWSECGLAVIAYWEEEIDEPTKQEIPILIERYPEVFDLGEPVKNLEGLVMMKFLFQPTSFNDFKENYMYRIPYHGWNGWNEYITEKSR